MKASKALLTVLALGLVACDSPMGTDGGRVRLTLSSGDFTALAAPATGPAATGDYEGEYRPLFQSANVTFSSIFARNTSGQLIDMGVEDLPVIVDVVAMEEGGRTVTLPDGVLPAATYDQIVVVMTGVEAVLRDGTTIAITPPGGGWTAVVPICPLVVEESSTSVVDLMLPVRSAFVFAEGRFRFMPRFRTRVRCELPPPPDEPVTD
jgi:hypothetical protein